MPVRRNNDVPKAVLPSARRQSARDAMMRITQELIQSQASSLKENLPANQHMAESAPAQGASQSVTEQKTRILQAIQPVLEVVADSAVQHNDPGKVQP